MYGIELWLDSGGRLMLSDPERPVDDKNEQIKKFRLPLENGNGIFGGLVFEYVATVKGRRMFQAISLYSEPDQQHNQLALWSSVLGMLQVEPQPI